MAKPKAQSPKPKAQSPKPKAQSLKSNFVYALGLKSNGKITFHCMPFYGSKKLQDAFGDTLAPYITGKSCFEFNPAKPLPLEVFKNIVTDGSTYLDEIVSQSKNKTALR